MDAVTIHAAWYLTKHLISEPLGEEELMGCLGVDCKDRLFPEALQLARELHWLTGSSDLLRPTEEGLLATSSHWRLYRPANSTSAKVLKLTGAHKYLLSKTDMDARPKILDLFAGVGGLGLGFESAGFKVEASIDNDPQAAEAHALNFPDCVTICGDVNELAKDPITFLRAHGASYEIDGIVGGPPCQGFSNIGERVISDDRNFLTTRFAEIVKALKPKFFVLENVPGLQKIGVRRPLVDWMIENSSSIGLYASAWVDNTPPTPKRLAKRDRQYRKRLISALVTEAYCRFLDDADLIGNDLNKLHTDCVRSFHAEVEKAFSGAPEPDLQDWMKTIECMIVADPISIDRLCWGLVIKALKSGRKTSNDLYRLIGEFTEKSPNSELSKLFEIHSKLPTAAAFGKTEIGPVLQALLERFSEEYDVAEPRVLTATDYGCPQSRRRLIIVGFRKDLGIQFKYPEPTYNSGGSKFLPLTPVCADALSDLPNVDKYRELLVHDSLSMVELSQPFSEFQKNARLLTIEPDDKSMPRPTWNPFRIDSSNRTVHADHVVARLEATREGIQDSTSGKTRLRRDGFSHTLRAGTREGKGSHTAVRPIHYEWNRVISVREGARLMGFPDWVKLHHTKWHGFRLVGNAVPKALGQVMGNAIKKELQELALCNSPAVMPSDFMVSQTVGDAA